MSQSQITATKVTALTNTPLATDNLPLFVFTSVTSSANHISVTMSTTLAWTLSILHIAVVTCTAGTLTVTFETVFAKHGGFLVVCCEFVAQDLAVMLRLEHEKMLTLSNYTH